METDGVRVYSAQQPHTNQLQLKVPSEIMTVELIQRKIKNIFLHIRSSSYFSSDFTLYRPSLLLSPSLSIYPRFFSHSFEMQTLVCRTECSCDAVPPRTWSYTKHKIIWPSSILWLSLMKRERERGETKRCIWLRRPRSRLAGSRLHSLIKVNLVMMHGNKWLNNLFNVLNLLKIHLCFFYTACT